MLFALAMFCLICRRASQVLFPFIFNSFCATKLGNIFHICKKATVFLNSRFCGKRGILSPLRCESDFVDSEPGGFSSSRLYRKTQPKHALHALAEFCGKRGIRTHGTQSVQRFSRPPRSTTPASLLVVKMGLWPFLRVQNYNKLLTLARLCRNFFYFCQK